MHKKILVLLGSFLCVSSSYAMEEPIFRYIRSGQVEYVEDVLGDPEILSKVNKDGNTPLMQAIISMKNGDRTIVDMILEKTDESTINLVNNKGNTPLLVCAAASRPADLCYDLIKKGANKDAQNEGWTALTFAAQNGDKDLCAMFIKQGVNLNVQDAEGFTPLMIAVHYNHTPVVELLLKEKAACSKTDLEWAKEQKNINQEIINLLTKYCKPETHEDNKALTSTLAKLSHSLDGLGQLLKKK